MWSRVAFIVSGSVGCNNCDCCYGGGCNVCGGLWYHSDVILVVVPDDVTIVVVFVMVETVMVVVITVMWLWWLWLVVIMVAMVVDVVVVVIKMVWFWKL